MNARPLHLASTLKGQRNTECVDTHGACVAAALTSQLTSLCSAAAKPLLTLITTVITEFRHEGK